MSETGSFSVWNLLDMEHRVIRSIGKIIRELLLIDYGLPLLRIQNIQTSETLMEVSKGKLHPLEIVNSC